MTKPLNGIPASKTDRKSNFELLRILAMLMIVASHWGWWHCFFPDPLHKPAQFLFYSYFRTFGQVGVDIFILISGYFLCKNQFKTIALLKLLAQVFCTICFLLILFFVRGYMETGRIPTMKISVFINWFLPISTGKWWFVSCYVALLLMSPFINKMIEHLKKNEFRMLLAAMFVFVSVVPSFFVIAHPTDVGQNMALFVFVYLIGAYIRLYEEDFNNKFLCFGGAFLSLVIFIIGKKYGFVEYRYFLHVIALSVFLFLSFKHMNIQSKIINTCAKTTFGVYLLHENDIVTRWLWTDLFAIQNYANTAWFIPVSIASVIITFFACAGIEYLRQSSIEPLFLKGMRTPKVSSWLARMDDKMPKNQVKPEEGTKSDPTPALVLLSATALFFVGGVLEALTQKNLSYYVFLLATAIILTLVLIGKRRTKSRGPSLS